MKTIITIFIFSYFTFTSFAFSSQYKNKGIAVLIPGLFNKTLPYVSNLNSKSKSPIYFSSQLYDALDNNHYDTLTIAPLNWNLSLSELGQEVSKKILDRLYHQNYRTPVALIGHSSGGLVALFVAQELLELNIESKIISLGTPFLSSPVADYVTSNGRNKNLLSKIDELTGYIFDFNGVYQISQAQLNRQLTMISLPSEYEVVAFAGVQKQNSLFFPSLSSKLQSPLFIPFNLLMNEASDGIVEKKSALPSFLKLANGNLKISSYKNSEVPLDHLELILDPLTIKKILPVKNVEYIKQEQIKLYNQITSQSL
jgi:hypothetical protein